MYVMTGAIRREWVKWLLLFANSCSGPPTPVSVGTTPHEDSTVSIARRHLLEARAIQGGVADLLSDEDSSVIDVGSWGEGRHEFVDALARRYHETLASLPGVPGESRRRDFAFEMLLEEWNPIGYPDEDVLRVMGPPQDVISAGQDNAIGRRILKYSWGSLRSSDLMIGVQNGRVISLERRGGSG